MRAKFIRNQDSKKSMQVGSHKPREGYLDPEIVEKYCRDFKLNHEMPLGTTGIISYNHNNMDIEGERRYKWYEFVFNSYPIKWMETMRILKQFEEGLIDIMDEYDTNYEWNKYNEYWKLKINIKKIE